MILGLDVRISEGMKLEVSNELGAALLFESVVSHCKQIFRQILLILSIWHILHPFFFFGIFFSICPQV